MTENVGGSSVDGSRVGSKLNIERYVNRNDGEIWGD